MNPCSLQHGPEHTLSRYHKLKSHSTVISCYQCIIQQKLFKIQRGSDLYKYVSVSVESNFVKILPTILMAFLRICLFWFCVQSQNSLPSWWFLMALNSFHFLRVFCFAFLVTKVKVFSFSALKYNCRSLLSPCTLNCWKDVN